ncbi:hypothetical protein L218DRAFT_958680 [Marasmius fiardii PR-910]|nr:hypothetical protein L218DRAFT_958680 [Marasmius fiardii PR-910]
MFARRKRFEQEKESGVPPPGTYDPQEAQFDTYKKGVILDKADRFCKEEESEIPGPGPYHDHVKTNAKRTHSAHNTNDRYVALQRKLEDLEYIHSEGKRSHLAEVERLKTELARNQKSNGELKERLDKQTRQGAALEHRLEELKRTASADKVELKDLSTKLRLSDHQRLQVIQAEVKKALQVVEARRKEEARERDKKVVELEKSLASETKRCALMGEQLKTKDQEIKSQGESIQLLKGEVVHARDEIEALHTQYRGFQADSSVKEEFLLSQLENHRAVLENVAQEYGRLAATTISKSMYDDLRHQHSVLQIQHLRTQRKLMNSESQVSELAHLIRQIAEDGRFTHGCLREAEDEIRFYQDNTTQYNSQEYSDSSISRLRRRVKDDIDLSLLAKLAIAEQEASFFDLAQQQTFHAYSSVTGELRIAQTLVHVQKNELLDAEAANQSLKLELKETQGQRGTAEELLKVATNTANDLRVSLDIFKRQTNELEAKLEEERHHVRASLEKEKENTRRLAHLVQTGRMAEDGLRAEVEQLTTELIDAEGYQEAYYSLRDHLETLSARNTLAEEEAQKLSAFNAQMIGHHNPAQRIMYVERIRNELAETKHKLLASTKSHEAVVALNDDLREELDMYKVISENRPKTTLTRVARPPLVDINQSQPWGNMRTKGTDGRAPASNAVPMTDSAMTLDEIL